MKEQALDPGNRAALQALASLSSVVGLSALVSSLVLSRSGSRPRDAGYATFEVFVVVAAATAAIFTAFLSVLLLNRGEAVSGADLFRTAAPLLVSLVLLVVLTSVARFSPSGDLATNFPILLATVSAAVVVGVAPGLMAPDPTAITLVVAGILGLGMAFGWVFLMFERHSLHGKRREVHRRLEKLSVEGFVPFLHPLEPLIPKSRKETDMAEIVCWERKGKLYLDQSEARQLRDAVDRGWTDLTNGNAIPPLGTTILSQCSLKTKLLPWPPKFLMTVTVHRRGEGVNAAHELKVSEHGLFDITALGLFASAE
ncbi:MAG TPA: hypothetical protein VFU16_02420 [Solirubrobacterales bacterium]|nr:hypothetical protein [Solirubrobacterales bacterium]